MAVDPKDFVGEAATADGPPPCSPGGVQSYVATLIDVTEPSDGGPPSRFELASSAPTPCDQLVTFSYAITYHRYIALIDGYDRPSQAADDARVAAALAADAGGNTTPSPGAIAATGSGSRLQADRNGLRVQKKWTTTCGAYQPSLDSGTPDAGQFQGNPPGEYAYSTLTQTLHNCVQPSKLDPTVDEFGLRAVSQDATSQ